MKSKLMTNKSFNKIFCIGLNKTGTTSLHYAFLMLGLRSLHWAPSDLDSTGEMMIVSKTIRQEMNQSLKKNKPMLGRWSNYDAYSDIYPIIKKFHILDKQYPNSKFIYTDRDEDAWIKSRVKHINQNLAAKERGDYDSPFVKIDEPKWRKEKRDHYRAVTEYFADRPQDLLIMNICAGDGFERLAPFLGLPIPAEAFPHKNVSNTKLKV
jgi:hypothetical protein